MLLFYFVSAIFSLEEGQSLILFHFYAYDEAAKGVLT